ncbi:gamma-glutamyl-gamma-aminobutyrate hydrolase family protein [Candidatus Berkiella aquae]|uniref:Gamma-glutamyl-gamma-aminobutyrate hydrolase PuuD n=1 Tax=Candidatus Berkiella aquae TaxID=295108 RepID=A0A0Q9YI50_9GAMM|nr:gamma-glutamyl-gamma-aminobutyrate hydrolase family protein [Candidatus Berkiella aquae]MCS5712322.1 gamma-glutamyl-gamma-aminobutyrate hydrolase family protein [Candidatus Berkiella aquae]
MIIYITQKKLKDKHGQSLDVLENAYIQYYLANHMFAENAVFIPVTNHLQQTMRLTQTMKPDWIIFTGGNNVTPDTNSEKALVDDLCPDRDEVERYLIQYADMHHIPKLAICRGFQFLNVIYGGQLSYFLTAHGELRKHPCVFEEQEYLINSYHQHGIKVSQLSAQLKPIVLADDNVVEAYVNVSDKLSPTLGVQWHPERDAIKPDLFKMIWEKFVNESTHFSRRHG